MYTTFTLSNIFNHFNTFQPFDLTGHYPAPDLTRPWAFPVHGHGQDAVQPGGDGMGVQGLGSKNRFFRLLSKSSCTGSAAKRNDGDGATGVRQAQGRRLGGEGDVFSMDGLRKWRCLVIYFAA